jgi:hypothetical protein
VAIGERTDLRIDARSPDGGPITVVVEVKTAWNDEVTTNLPTQLVGQYMHDIGTNAGIFLVLWASPSRGRPPPPTERSVRSPELCWSNTSTSKRAKKPPTDETSASSTSTSPTPGHTITSWVR